MFYKKLCFLLFLSVLSSVVMAEKIIDINNQTQVDGVGTSYISGFTFYNKEVTYEKKDGLAVFEGDIILGTIQELESWNSADSYTAYSGISPRSVIITGQRFRWINNIVPFQFDEDVPVAVRDMVLEAMDHWRNNTAMEFVERNENNAAEFPDFVTVISEAGCWSFVGRQGGEQELNVVEACGLGSTVHELGHAIGLWHEQSREDRNDFVAINWNNIEEGREHNFNQHINDGDDIGGYDYGSIMHYGAFAFSVNNEPTITPLQEAEIGQRIGLSELDIASIAENYPEIIPIARLDKSTYSIFLGNSVFFDATQSFDPNGDNLIYSWDLGDGTVINSELDALNHLYENRGIFEISLTVTDPDGNSDTDTAVSNVYGFEVLIPVISLLL